MDFMEHVQKTHSLLGEGCPEVHIYLDKYFKYFRNEAHRLILHHEEGAKRVAKQCADLYGYDTAYRAAVQHILDDMGWLPATWKTLAPHLIFLCCREVNDARQFLLIEFPLGDFTNLEFEINY